MPITVLLADDTEIIRRVIRRLLETESEIEIVGEAGDFAQTIKLTALVRPQVVVMDLHMADGLEVDPATVRAAFASSKSLLLAISIWDDEDSKVLAAEYGSPTLLAKHRLVAELIPAIKRLPL